eukprot:gene20984-biopygen15490
MRTDEKWEEWDFHALLEALRIWTDRNPYQQYDREGKPFQKEFKREKTFTTRGQLKPRQCAYCDKQDHKSSDCQQVSTIEERRKILSDKRLCFSCTGTQHRASECRSRSTCLVCKRKHHTSICDKAKQDQILTTTNERKVIHPVVVIEIEGIRCRALLDTGASTSYVSSTVTKLIKKQPVRQEFKTIEMMLWKRSKRVDIYDVEFKDLKGIFSLRSEVNAIDREVLLTLPNPKYAEIVAKNGHLEGVQKDDNDSKPYLPIHAKLEASGYPLIKTTTPTRIGTMGQPIAEKTKFGWVIMSPGQEDENSSALMYTRTANEDYMELCRLDVLGIEDKPEGDQSVVYKEFTEQLHQRPDGRYETSLPWKPGHPKLPSNRAVAEARFNPLMRRLEKQPEMLKAYDNIIQTQLNEGIVEKAQSIVEGPEHYIPHKPVVRENAESTKIRIVYNASAKKYKNSPSLNDCLEVGPPLPRKVLDILTRMRLQPILLAGDIQQAFLQIVIRESERDALRFIWIDDLESRKQTIYRVTRVLFGLTPSPFLLNGTLQQHFDKYEETHENLIRELHNGIYVDDIHLGGKSEEEVAEMKQTAISIFEEGHFKLHKWHSNAPKLDGESAENCEQTFAKQNLGVKTSETKILGIKWNKKEDELSITFPRPDQPATKRVVLSTIAMIYDPSGIASPVLLTAKVLFRDICEHKLPWDVPLPNVLLRRWERWLQTLPGEVKVPRSIPVTREQITLVELHGFADASILGCCAVVFAVVRQGDNTNQGLLVSKSRLSKKDLTIPRLELVSCHMLSNI